jgi:hypothetical protein
MPAKKIAGIRDRAVSIAVAVCLSDPAGTSNAIGINRETMMAKKSRKIKYGLYG